MKVKNPWADGVKTTLIFHFSSRKFSRLRGLPMYRGQKKFYQTAKDNQINFFFIIKLY